MSTIRPRESTAQGVERDALGPARDTLAFSAGLALGLLLGSTLVALLPRFTR